MLQRSGYVQNDVSVEPMTATSSTSGLMVPGPPPSLFGRFTHVFRFGRDSIGYTRQLFDTYGPIVSLTTGGKTNIYSPLPQCPGTVFACGPEFVQAVTTQHEIYYKYPLSGPLYRLQNTSPRTKPLGHFGVGLFGLNSTSHLQSRRLMMPAFHKQRLESYLQDMVAITASELDQIKVEQSCEVTQLMQRLTLRIATKTLFGEDMSASNKGTGQIMQEAFRMQGAVSTNLFPLDLPGFAFHRYLNRIAEFESKMRDMIAEKRRQERDDPDILSMLIRAQYEDSGLGLTEDELIGHVGVMFAAGHETSANALTWTVFLLSQHPQVAADLLDELEGTLQGAAPTVEQLQHLPFLEQVIKESLRVLSPVPWNGRVTAQPTELGGYFLPQGTEVFISIYHTHHSPELYADPEAFNPYRWERINPTSYEYNPFSAGPRVCIGAAFAMMEIKVVLAMLLQRYRLQYIAPHRVDRDGAIVMRPKYGMPMEVYRQDRQFTQGVGGVCGNVREMVNLP
ncbi:MAG: cytochrome P450 [Microcoleaceae cyanobacterium]